MKKNNASNCCCCGKPLSDPISVSLGIGPVCRVNQKQKMLEEKTGNIFANRADFDDQPHAHTR